MIDPVPPSLNLQQTVTVTNPTDRSGTFQLGFTGGLPAGAVPTVTPSTLILGAGESQPVQVDLQIDNTTVPFAPEEPLSYEGALQIEAPGSQLYRLPLAFLKSPILELSWDEEPFVVSIYETEGSKGLVARFSFPGTEEELWLPQSTYDIVTLFRGGGTHRVFREAVPVTDRTVLSIERAEARHSLTLTPVDENGEPLTPFNLVRDETTILMRHRTSSSDIFGGASASTLWFSDVSDAFLFEIGLFIRRGAGSTYTFFTHEDQGIDSSRVVTNDPADYKRVEIHHRGPEIHRPDPLGAVPRRRAHRGRGLPADRGEHL